MPHRTLPDYDNPPAQETWMAFSFVPLAWSVPHFGAFWSELREDYPTFEVHPPIGEFNVEFNSAAVATPESPAYPLVPFPAIVPMFPVTATCGVG